jgi:hypothetical protein|tara:strand:+ start:571 stop:759 length:189 start_codon:yes stop_codon:yes gene_type:complete
MLCKCGSRISPARQELGYRLCLPCGEASAKTIAQARKKQVGITYNKGGYQYITENDLKTLGR